MATVAGHCYLQGEGDHSSSKILFDAITPSAVTDSTFTAIDGSFEIGLSEGAYNVYYIHDGFQMVTLNGLTFGPDTHSLPEVTLEIGFVVEVSGAVQGEWTSDAIYAVTDEIWVSGGETLVIYPGTTVRFMGEYGLNVYGALHSAGTPADSISYTSSISSPGSWSGITFHEGSTGDFEHVVVEYASTGIYVAWDAATSIHHALVSMCETGIEAYHSSLSVHRCRIETNTGSGIHIRYMAALITECEVYDNGGQGISLYGGGRTTAKRNIVANNGQSGMRTRNNASLTALSNTIFGNTDAGVWGDDDCLLICEGNILVGNLDGVRLSQGSLPVSVAYNDIYGNSRDQYSGDFPPEYGATITTNANGDSCDTYFNISQDPLFIGIDDFNIQAGSPCIDAGNPAPEYYDLDGTIADIGAFPYYYGDSQAPLVSFTASATSGTSPFPVEFTHTNTGGPITHWVWDFGDGGSSNSSDPTHTYITQVQSMYTVTLTASGPGGTDTISYSDMIEVSPALYPPDARFDASPETGYGTVQFEDRSLGLIESYEWDFGDSHISTEENPEHTYGSPGVYTVALTVSGPHGSDTMVREDFISILVPDSIVAGFEPSMTTGVAPVAIAFTNTTIGTVSSYLWNFGNGDTSSEESPGYLFTAPGEYGVSLVASGPTNSDTTSTVIKVVNPAPEILSIVDVPSDQGGYVYLEFSRSGHDSEVPRSEMYTVERNDGGIWVTVLSGGASGQETYTYLVSTARDSTAGDDGMTEFRVLASMDEGTYWSETAWGYSVDNLAPGVPSGLLASQVPGEGNLISWDSSLEQDFNHFSLYRGEAEDFEISEDCLLFSGTGLSWFDSNGDALHWYKLTSSDHAGNSSPPATTVVDEVPVLLSSFKIEVAPGSVSLRWTVEDDLDEGSFRLYGERTGEEWTVEHSPLAPSSFVATDRSASVFEGGEITYKLYAREGGHGWELLRTQSVLVEAAPLVTALSGAYPNPFNPRTLVSFSMASPGALRISVSDVSGRQVAVLVDGEIDRGMGSVEWNGRDSLGRDVASGLYFILMETRGYSETTKVVLVR